MSIADIIVWVLGLLALVYLVYHFNRNAQEGKGCGAGSCGCDEVKASTRQVKAR